MKINNQTNKDKFIYKTISELILSCAIRGKEKAFATSKYAIHDGSSKKRPIYVIGLDEVEPFFSLSDNLLNHLISICKDRGIK